MPSIKELALDQLDVSMINLISLFLLVGCDGDPKQRRHYPSRDKVTRLDARLVYTFSFTMTKSIHVRLFIQAFATVDIMQVFCLRCENTEN